ncbi:MAG: MerR family transcriptional regulator [Actinomycetota bacterium]|nr:MerR family transcriptional regulator [Actinomycetota bacterium]
MRISDLSRRGDVAIPTIKFYLREGLLPPGQSTARNQAVYTEEHLARLRFVRTLITVGRLPVATVREVLAAVDASDLSVEDHCRLIQHALRVDRIDSAAEASPSTVAQAGELIRRLGWRVDESAPGIAALAQISDALRQLGWQGEVEAFSVHAELARMAVRRERELAMGLPVATAAACYVLFEMALTTLRGLAHEDLLATAGALPDPSSPGAPPKHAASGRGAPPEGQPPTDENCPDCRPGPAGPR